MGNTFRFEPLAPAHFPVGQGPFQARGLAYVSLLKYIDARLPGGRAAFRAALAGDPFGPFFDRPFLVTGEYDLSPLMRLYLACAGIEKKPVARFIEERARSAAEADTQGVWRPMLKASTPEDAAARSHLGATRYFPSCRASVIASAPGRFEGELSAIPAPMSGMFASTTTGSIEAALRLRGAGEVKIAWDRPVPEGASAGVPVEKARFVATWSS